MLINNNKVLYVNFVHDSTLAFKVADDHKDIPEGVDHLLAFYRGPYGIKNKMDIVTFTVSRAEDGVLYFDINPSAIIMELNVECDASEVPLRWALLKEKPDADTSDKFSPMMGGYVKPVYGYENHNSEEFALRKALMGLS